MENLNNLEIKKGVALHEMYKIFETPDTTIAIDYKKQRIVKQLPKAYSCISELLNAIAENPHLSEKANEFMDTAYSEAYATLTYKIEEMLREEVKVKEGALVNVDFCEMPEDLKNTEVKIYAEAYDI